MLIGNGYGTFQAATTYTTGDVNGDGSADLLVSSLTGDSVAVYKE